MAKRITAIVSLAIIGIIIIATIIMASVKVDYRIKCATPDEIRISSNSWSDIEPASSEEKSKIISLINNSSKETALSALFSGSLFDHAKVITDNSSSVSSIPTKSNCYYVNYVYFTPQTLKVGNKNFKDENGKTYQYKELCFEVCNTDGVEEIKVYIIPDSTKPTSYSRYYLLTGNFSKLYNFLSERN